MPKNNILLTLVLTGIMITPCAFAAEWGYSGKYGPDKWGKLDPAYQSCLTGNKQSPIDINDKNVRKEKSLPDLAFSYTGAPLVIGNNGHTIQVSYPKGNTATLGNSVYDLVQFHFHTPSEHTIEGK